MVTYGQCEMCGKEARLIHYTDNLELDLDNGDLILVGKVMLCVDCMKQALKPTIH